MKKSFRVKGYSFNLKKMIDRVYYEGEIFVDEGRNTELGGACICVAHRFRDNPRFATGDYTITEITD